MIKRIVSIGLLMVISVINSYAEDINGKTVFNANCMVCHQAGGIGVSGYAPPLSNALTQKALGSDGRSYFPRVLLGGMSGTIQANGETFNGNMPSFSKLPNEELAAVLNYVIGSLNSGLIPDKLQPYTAEELMAMRSKIYKPSENRKFREQLEKGS